uniref:Nucleoside diphosphate-linked moiety X motif 6 n=1 Tax=Electrophorus electricus TaxID=8005 RepID=A0A4W4EBZ9_ELEEL
MTALTRALPCSMTALATHTVRRAVSAPRPFPGCAQLVGFTAQSGLTAPLLTGEVDRFGGVTVRDFPANVSEAALLLVSHVTDSLSRWRSEGRTAAWLHVPLSLSRLAAAAAVHGFAFHHARRDAAVLSLWLGPGESRLPGYATHQVGVAGKRGPRGGDCLWINWYEFLPNVWKFPGGLSDPGEDIGATAIREVFEETGVQSEFRSLLCIRQQHNHPGAFGMSDMYLICRLSPLTYDVSVCPHECLRCDWLGVAELAERVDATPITRRVASLLRYGLEQGFSSVDLSREDMPAVYTGLIYQLYHRKLPPGH